MRRTESEARRCSQADCLGDGRYQPPGKGHLPGCNHDAVKWVWEDLDPTDVITDEQNTPIAASICPECRQGKHVNCTEQVLIGDDYLDCECPECNTL